jgi:hypothetical protein
MNDVQREKGGDIRCRWLPKEAPPPLWANCAGGFPPPHFFTKILTMMGTGWGTVGKKRRKLKMAACLDGEFL